MSSTNGSTQTLSEIREELKRMRAERRLKQARLAVDMEAHYADRLRESFNWSYTSGTWGTLVDPFDAFRDPDIQRAFPTGNQQDRKDGRNLPFVWTDLDLDLMRGQARWLADRNSYGIGALNNLTNYAIKTGFQWEVHPRKRYRKDASIIELAQQVEDCLDEFSDKNGLPQYERDCFRRSRRDGEVFVRAFAQDDGSTLLRDIEPEQVRMPLGSPPNYMFGILTEPNDVTKALEYAVSYGDPADWESVPADDVCHLKLNVDRCIKRGLSDFFANAELLDSSRKLVRNLVETGGVQAAIAWIEQFDQATASSVQANVASIRDQNRQYYNEPITGRPINYQRYEPGTVPKVSKGRTYVPPPWAVGASVHIAIAQAGLRAIAARWCMPEYMLSGDASNANYSSTLVSGSPFVNAMECEQDTYAHYFRCWRWIAVRNAARSGRFGGWHEKDIERVIDIHATPPEVAIADELKESQIDDIDIRNGVLSKQTRRAKRGLEEDQEVANIKQQPMATQANPLASLFGTKEGSSLIANRWAKLREALAEPTQSGSETHLHLPETMTLEMKQQSQAMQQLVEAAKTMGDKDRQLIYEAVKAIEAQQEDIHKLTEAVQDQKPPVVDNTAVAAAIAKLADAFKQQKPPVVKVPPVDMSALTVVLSKLADALGKKQPAAVTVERDAQGYIKRLVTG